jgi:hypothetical protein
MNRRIALSLAPAAACAAALTTPASALASDTWCDVDPVQLVVTNGGALVPIFVTNGAPSLLYAPQLLLARITHSTQSVDSGAATLVTVSVTVPKTLFGGTFPTRSVVSSGPLGLLKTYAIGAGTSGSPIVMRFKLPIG